MSGPVDEENSVIPQSQTVTSDLSIVDQYAHIIVRGGIIATGLVGLAVFLKTSPTFARFNHIRKIPQNFIRNEIEMKGIVKDVSVSGTIKVEHQPLVMFPFLVHQKKLAPLKLKLAGIELSKQGAQFLTKDLNLVNKPITFRVVKPTAGDSDSMDVDMTIKKSIFGRSNVNQDFIRRGYAKIPNPNNNEHVAALEQNPIYSRLITKLLMSEKIANQRGVGMWERESWVESVQSVPSQTYGMLKGSPVIKLFILLGTIMKDTGYLTLNVLRQLYFICIATSGYLSDGYRKFGRTITALSLRYEKTKGKLQNK
uniref:TNase-like domain-containing protein n=1 Tax=Rhabditophanes sp. KR3021 TaxID=114890 RepID=A0AC35U3N7_9BILA